MRGILKRASVQDGFGCGRVVVIEGVMRMTLFVALLVISIAAITAAIPLSRATRVDAARKLQRA